MYLRNLETLYSKTLKEKKWARKFLRNFQFPDLINKH